jgi:hypothetical protein
MVSLSQNMLENYVAPKNSRKGILIPTNYCVFVLLFSCRREKAKSATHLYVMEIKSGTFLDASRKASISRFINHSCEPNCTVEIWTVRRRLRAGIFAIKDIAADTELTFDYKWELSVDRPPTK